MEEQDRHDRPDSKDGQLGDREGDEGFFRLKHEVDRELLQFRERVGFEFDGESFDGHSPVFEETLFDLSGGDLQRAKELRRLPAIDVLKWLVLAAKQSQEMKKRIEEQTEGLNG